MAQYVGVGFHQEAPFGEIHQEVTEIRPEAQALKTALDVRVIVEDDGFSMM